ncbi:MAG: GerMN domain-containing protein [Tepidanaerobacteraceae bacterium]|jgi:germination protein M|nr:GerMN domain-containing protein [Tepidanaerobacteraceae bacterium]
MPKKSICFIILICMVLCIAGCGLFKKKGEETIPPPAGETQQVQANVRKTVFYFVNDNNLLVPVTREIPWVEGIGRAALECLVDSPELRAELAEKGLKPSLPEGTRILGLTIKEGLAKVDFSREFLNSRDKAAEQNAVNSVVYTLTEFPAVDKVQILVEGKPLKKCPNGTVLKDVLFREKINIEPGEIAAAKDLAPVTLYFKSSSQNGSFTYFVPVTRMVKKSDNMIKTALEELIKGPRANMGLVSVLPQDTKVLEATQKESEVVVNFSKEIEGYGGGADVEQALVNSVVLTVTQFPGVEKVSLQVEGKAGVLPEGTILDNPILKPIYVNPSNI